MVIVTLNEQNNHKTSRNDTTDSEIDEKKRSPSKQKMETAVLSPSPSGSSCYLPRFQVTETLASE